MKDVLFHMQVAEFLPGAEYQADPVPAGSLPYSRWI
jgi:hypothetical protein